MAPSLLVRRGSGPQEVGGVAGEDVTVVAVHFESEILKLLGQILPSGLFSGVYNVKTTTFSYKKVLQKW